MYKIITSQSNQHLYDILELQSANSIENLNPEEIIKEGFITIKHSFESLEKMQQVTPHALAYKDNNLVGYALATTKEFKSIIPEVSTLVQTTENALFKNKPIQNYLIMGQICIEKSARKKGIFKALYNHLFLLYHEKFNCIITEILTSNIRSINAHQSIGFENYKRFYISTNQWVGVIWHW